MDRLSRITEAADTIRECFSGCGHGDSMAGNAALDKLLESLQSDQCALPNDLMSALNTVVEIHLKDLHSDDHWGIEMGAVPRFIPKEAYVRAWETLRNYALSKTSPAPPVSVLSDLTMDQTIVKNDGGNEHEPHVSGTKLPGVYVPLTMSRNMKSRALAHGIDPERLAEAWSEIISGRPFAYQDRQVRDITDDEISAIERSFIPLPQPPEES